MKAVRRSGRTVPLPIVLATMLIGGLLALLALNTASAASELDQRTLNDANAATAERQQQLMGNLATERAPAALASAAASLGLIPDTNPAFLQLEADGTVRILGEPAPAARAAGVATGPLIPTPTPTPAPTTPATPSTKRAASPKPAAASPRVTPSKPTATPSKPAPTSPSPAGSSHPVEPQPSPTKGRA